MAKDGIGVIVVLTLFSSVLTLGAWKTEHLWLMGVAIVSWLLIGGVIYFFRDPSRVIPVGENVIVAPADGKIIGIEEANEPEYLCSKATKVSIFMSLFDVHINRIPLSGRVSYFNYIKGRFYPAYKEKASSSNEQTIIGIEHPRCKVLFKQIAGVLARRIACRIREGDRVKKGERFGMIKLGSRVELFLPQNVTLKVRLNDRVKAGESIIGVIVDGI